MFWVWSEMELLQENTNWNAGLKFCQGFLFLEWAEWKHQAQIPSPAQKWELLEFQAHLDLQFSLSFNFCNASAFALKRQSLSAGAGSENSEGFLGMHTDYDSSKNAVSSGVFLRVYSSWITLIYSSAGLINQEDHHENIPKHRQRSCWTPSWRTSLSLHQNKAI